MPEQSMDHADDFSTTTVAPVSYKFEMAWKGSLDPVGARVGNTEVLGIFHGMVKGKGHGALGVPIDLGTYKRLETNGGPSGDEQIIRITTLFDTATNPDGTPCQLVGSSTAPEIKNSIKAAGKILTYGNGDLDAALETLKGIVNEGNPEAGDAFKVICEFAKFGGGAFMANNKEQEARRLQRHAEEFVSDDSRRHFFNGQNPPPQMR
ncbi:MAG: hypothetical protein KDJ15_06320 [Alphaproteobacteria bacterium]|nr:hypothetical protein [Alphaproteobacteria bacterium]